MFIEIDKKKWLNLDQVRNIELKKNGDNWQYSFVTPTQSFWSKNFKTEEEAENWIKLLVHPMFVYNPTTEDRTSLIYGYKNPIEEITPNELKSAKRGPGRPAKEKEKEA